MRKVLVVLVAIVSVAGFAGTLIGRRTPPRRRSANSAAGALKALVRNTRKGVDSRLRQSHKQIHRTHQSQRARQFKQGADCFVVRGKQRLDEVFRVLKRQLSS
jgi:hypothetical protein